MPNRMVQGVLSKTKYIFLVYSLWRDIEDKKQHERIKLSCCPGVHLMENKVSRECLPTTQLDRAAIFGSNLGRS